MKPTELLARAPTGDGDEMTLTRRDGAYYLNLRYLRSSGELMTSRAHGSEKALATLACAAMPKTEQPRVLVGGLGFGYTLRAALDALPATATVVVAELFDLVLTANRGEVGELAGRPLDDPRVRLYEGDVRDRIRDRGAYDAILLDVDNGPSAFVHDANAGLYTRTGVRAAFEALRSPGVLVVWSLTRDEPYLQRLREAGFAASEHLTRARSGGRKKHVLIAGVKR
jgi:spermidine synthase